MCDYFATFCWLWNFLLENLKLKKYSDDVHWTNMKTFQITRFWFIYILAQILFFGGTALGRFFYFSSLANHGDRHFYLVHPPSPHHKKASYGPVIIMEIFSIGWISYAVLSNSFRSSRPEVFYKKVRKILQNSQEITFARVSFWPNFFELLKYKKVRAKHKFVSGYSATKRTPFYCKWVGFKFSISSSCLDLVYDQFFF